jgi:EAL domain-containing protein (putative c-di-GMP-specific phosphodiesterase class I)
VLKSDTQFISNRWLFKYLTRVLDEQLLALVKKDLARFLAVPVSLNLNVETILSEHFEIFDGALKPEIKQSIVLELPVIDAFADMAAFNLARKQAQKMGYRVCLDGLTISSFINIDRKRLELDLLKVQWNADVESDITNKQNVELAKAVADCGSNRVILCRCDSKLAVDFGHALGVSLFQGRFIDSLVNPSLTVAN